jgi:photosystem II stability/assembly factor-like uncharacterized protein
VQWREWILQGDGVYKSTDGGETWEHVGLTDTQTISRIRLHPSDCDRVYAAAMGHPFGPNAERGVFRSTDGGGSWEKALFVNEETGAADLSIDPNNPDVLYAGLWQAEMKPWGGTDAGPGSGLYKSTDGGKTWTNLTGNPGLPDGLIGKVGVAVGANSDRVYAIFSARPDAGVYASDDAGETWRLVNDHGNLLARPHYYTRVVADPQEPDTVWVLSDSLSKSTDGGATFERVRAPHADHHDMWIDPTNSERMVNANDGGANVSTNGGGDWTEQDFSTAQMYAVETTNDEPYLVCGGQQENGTACVASDSDGSEFFSIGGGETAQVAVDPRDSDVFYAANFGGTNLTRFDRELPFQRKRIDVWPEIPFGHPPGGDKGTLRLVEPNRDDASLSAGGVHELAAPVPHDERRPELGADQPRPDPCRLVDAADAVRAGLLPPEQLLHLRDDLGDRTVAARPPADLGRVGRRTRARDPKRRAHVDEHHAAGHGALHVRGEDRRLSARARRSLRCGAPLQARRPLRPRVADGRLRRDVDANHGRDRRRPLRLRRPRGSRTQRAPLRGHRARRLRLLRRRRQLAVAAAELARLADPLIGLAITLVILRITWDAWHTVRHSR